jgi:signal transduction histidine kinase
MASEEQLEGVWINLLVNASDAIDHDHGEIRLSSKLVDRAIQVCVEDNGQGISEDKLSHIFEPFYTTKEQGHGTGLGLSICHRVVEQLGGKITVQSIPDSGLRFIVDLPVE